jgi:hydroxymethylpyrimidine/phosphomethylpyrimidine kinase
MDYFLTIAASDNSGGAGIQQDCKVAHELGYWALSA